MANRFWISETFVNDVRENGLICMRIRRVDSTWSTAQGMIIFKFILQMLTARKVINFLFNILPGPFCSSRLNSASAFYVEIIFLASCLSVGGGTPPS
jgi:hypothetical protein